MPWTPVSSPERVSFRGLLYRSLNPIYARDPLSGRGAALHGGRFNRRGTAALYTSLSPEGAIREANQVGTLQPTTLVAYRAEIGAVFDATSVRSLAAWSLTPSDLADHRWRERMATQQHVPTQEFAAALATAGFAGLFVPSYARGAAPEAVNLVLLRWNTGDDDRIEPVDDEGRLSR